MDEEVNLKLTASVNVEEFVPEAELAKRLAAELRVALAPVCAIMDRAHARGLQINFNIANNSVGKSDVLALSIIKHIL